MGKIQAGSFSGGKRRTERNGLKWLKIETTDEAIKNCGSGVNIMGAPRKRFKTAGAVWAAILRKGLGKQALYEKAQKA